MFKEFTGTLNLTGAVSHVLAVSGSLTKQDGLLSGRLELAEDYYLPIELEISNGSLVSKSITFQILNTLLPGEDLLGTETLVTIAFTGLVSNALTEITFTLLGTLFGNTEIFISGLLELNEVSETEPVVSYADPSELVSFANSIDKSLEVVNVNRKDNTFDNLGMLVGLPRLTEERNAEYAKRIQDVFVSRSSATYRGLLNGITRELGLISSPGVFDAIQLGEKGGYEVASSCDPVVVLDGSHLFLYTLYKDTTNFYLDSMYDLRSDTYRTVKDLVNAINADSASFSASLLIEDSNLQSKCLLRCSNLASFQEALPLSNRISLAYGCIKAGTVGFTDGKVYSHEVGDDDDVSLPGDFYIDYTNGILQSFDLPKLGTAIRYQHTQFPYILQASNIAITDLTNPWVNLSLYERIENEEYDSELDRYSPGLPSDEMIGYVKELLSIGRIYWGE